MIFEALVPFLLTCLVIELTPGPNMTYVALVSSLEGRRAGFSIVAGVACGLFVMGIAALSAATFILQKDGLYETLRCVGIFYLLWLAYDVWHGAKTEEHDPKSNRRYFYRGLITNLLNPKAAMFYVTVFPAFVSKEGNMWMHFIPMILMYVVVATVIHSGIVLFGARLQPYFEDERRAKHSRIFFTVALIAVAGWFAVSTAR